MNKQSYLIAVYIFFFSTGGYMVMPLFPLLTNVHDITIIQAGSLTAFYIFFQMMTPVLLGQLGDKYGYRDTAASGELIRGLSFLFIGFSDEYVLLIIFTITAGLGGGASAPSLQSLMMTSSPRRYFPGLSSLRVTSLSAGLITGPLAAGLCYTLSSLLLYFTVKPVDTTVSVQNINIKRVLETFRCPSFLRLLIVMTLFYFIFSQIFVTFPEHAKSFTNQIQSVFLIYGLTGLILQYPVGILIQKMPFSSRFYMKLGALFLTGSYLTLYLFTDQGLVFFTAVILFSLGPVLILPVFESLISTYSEKGHDMGRYFGVSRLSDGIGRPLGSIVGGWLYHTLNTKYSG